MLRLPSHGLAFSLPVGGAGSRSSTSWVLSHCPEGTRRLRGLHREEALLSSNGPDMVPPVQAAALSEGNPPGAEQGENRAPQVSRQAGGGDKSHKACRGRFSPRSHLRRAPGGKSSTPESVGESGSSACIMAPVRGHFSAPVSPAARALQGTAGTLGCSVVTQVSVHMGRECHVGKKGNQCSRCH